MFDISIIYILIKIENCQIYGQANISMVWYFGKKGSQHLNGMDAIPKIKFQTTLTGEPNTFFKRVTFAHTVQQQKPGVGSIKGNSCYRCDVN